MPADAAESMPADAAESMPADAAESMPADAAESMPADAEHVHPASHFCITNSLISEMILTFTWSIRAMRLIRGTSVHRINHEAWINHDLPRADRLSSHTRTRRPELRLAPLPGQGGITYLVAVADLAEVLDDGAEGVLDLLELARRQPVDEMPPDVLHMIGRDPLDGGHAVGGQHGERAPLVALAVVPPDQAADLHSRDLVG